MTEIVIIPKPLLILVVLIFGIRCQALSDNSIVGQRASVFSSGKDGEAGDIVCIVDGTGRRPDGKQAARSQSEFSDTAQSHELAISLQQIRINLEHCSL